ncbi:MAG: PA domain-containing protein, partial [Flavobacteriales bacterium]
LDTTAVTAPGAFAIDDGTYVEAGDAAGDSASCGDVINMADVDGKIAFIYRGICDFSLKAFNAQEAGAVACVIINNEPGNLINMLGGDDAPNVDIPVIFISDADGAALRDSIMDGTTELFIGNPNGVFANNVGAYKAHIGMASSQSLPEAMANPAEFDVPVGAWMFNFGSDTAYDAVVTAVIDRDGTELYNEVGTVADIAPEDSLFFSLPLFTQATYEVGLYTITYTLSTNVTDELPVDNVLTTSFWVNSEGLYSKSKIDPIDGPQGGSGIRPAEGTEYEWCVPLISDNVEPLWITGITFSTLTNDIDLTGQAVQLAVYEWNDPIADLTFTDLVEATDNEFYDYETDAQGEFVTHNFEQDVELVNGQPYLACATIFIDDMFLGVDADLDYNTTYDSYPDQVFFPLNDIDGGTWFAAGFGSDNTPAIIVNLAANGGIADDIEALDIVPFPNPTIDRVNIPFGSSLNGTVLLTVYNVEGQLVKSEELCVKSSSSLQVDVPELSSGLHTFNLKFEDNSETSFRVVITK